MSSGQELVAMASPSTEPDDILRSVELVAEHIVQNMSPFLKAAVSAEVPARSLIWWNDSQPHQGLMKANSEFLKAMLLQFPKSTSSWAVCCFARRIPLPLRRRSDPRK